MPKKEKLRIENLNDEFNRKRRNVMNKISKISRNTGIDRAQLQELVGFDSTKRVDTFQTNAEIRRAIESFDEITSRNFEPLKMKKLENDLLLPAIVHDQLMNKMQDLNENIHSIDFSWSQLETQDDLVNFIGQIDDILGDFSVDKDAHIQFSEMLYSDYLNILEEIGRRFDDGISLKNLLLQEVTPLQFYDKYVNDGLPPLFNVPEADSEQIIRFIEDMGNIISNFMRKQTDDG